MAPAKKKTLIIVIFVIILIIIASIICVIKYMSGFDKEHLVPKYMILVPQAGTIDMCCIVLTCIRYAKKHNRVLIIDSTDTWFNDDFNEYINIHSPQVYTGAADTITHKINALTTYPPNVNIEKLSDVVYDKQTKAYTVNGTSLSFPLNQDYDARIVVYSNGRQPGASLSELLEMCTFSPKVLDVFKSRRAQLPYKYVSVHIRNTDYDSDVPKFIEENNNVLEYKTIFLASDNKNSIDEMKSKYGSNIITFAYIPDNNGKPIHEGYKRTKEESRLYNVDTFVDILLLAAANEYYYSCKKSGFSQAILELRSKPALLSRLLK